MAEENTSQSPSEEETGFVELPFPNFYSNGAMVRSNFFDFSILFTEQIDQAHRTIKARLVMSPGHAKLLLGALLAQVEKYETRFGEIKLPPELITSGSSSEPEQPPSQSPPAASE
jgi:hypothetical protein